jgi:hypothetical protein
MYTLEIGGKPIALIDADEQVARTLSLPKPSKLTCSAGRLTGHRFGMVELNSM